MRNIRTFSDSRLDGWCFHCESAPGNTRDHVPPRVFLDRPFPPNLPVVASCEACNSEASRDEQYVAVLVEVTTCGSTDPAGVERPKIARTLRQRPALRTRLDRSLKVLDGVTEIGPEHTRVDRVLNKMARGIWKFEMSEATGRMRTSVAYQPASATPDDQLSAFLSLRPPVILPEVGSRMMLRTVSDVGRGVVNAWQVVQQDRFEYGVEAGGLVRMILRGYLLAEVTLYPEDG